ncbi:MAG TPA: PA2169 family four-helix-bundle protein [Edaphocola sp.]|nr:PA2169 family four-helix-bundle protein [Edaphocola sp.]
MKDNTIETLQDLMKINNDRIRGYKKASENLQQGQEHLKTLFKDLEEQSAANNVQIRDELEKLGGDLEASTTTGGKLFRTWMDLKDAFGVDSAGSVLESCERGEDAAKNAYQSALSSGNLTDSITNVIKQQSAKQLEAHNKIKQLRDQQQ